MADPAPSPDPHSDIRGATGDEAGVRPDLGSMTGTPRWVKVFGIIALVVALLLVILLFTRGSGGGHGPGMDMSAGALAGYALPAGGDQPWRP